MSCVLVATCDNGATDPESPAPIASTAVIAGGDFQETRLGLALPVPLAMRVLDTKGRGMQGVRVDWRMESGAGHFLTTASEAQPSSAVSFSDRDGLARVRLRPTATGTGTVVAFASGIASSLTFTLRTFAVPVLRLRFGPMWDCVPSGDPSGFWVVAGPLGLSVAVGETVELQYGPGMPAVCSARLRSVSAPAGASPFDSGPMASGESVDFVPGVAGEWVIEDVAHGGQVKLTVSRP
ncbi:MAG: hypothetical protein V4617_18920 [Gemmatimonadota bacterium]